MVEGHKGLQEMDQIKELWQHVTAMLKTGQVTGSALPVDPGTRKGTDVSKGLGTNKLQVNTYTHFCNTAMATLADHGDVAFVEEVWKCMTSLAEEAAQYGLATDICRPDQYTVAARFRAHMAAGKPVMACMALLQEMKQSPLVSYLQPSAPKLARAVSNEIAAEGFYTEVLVREMATFGHQDIIKRLHKHLAERQHPLSAWTYCFLLDAYLSSGSASTGCPSNNEQSSNKIDVSKPDHETAHEILSDMRRNVRRIMASDDPFQPIHFTHLFRAMTQRGSGMTRQDHMDLWRVMVEQAALSPQADLWKTILAYDAATLRTNQEGGTSLLEDILNAFYPESGISEEEHTNPARCDDLPALLRVALRESSVPTTTSAHSAAIQPWDIFQRLLAHHKHYHHGVPCRALSRGFQCLIGHYTTHASSTHDPYLDLAHIAKWFHQHADQLMASSNVDGQSRYNYYQPVLSTLLEAFFHPRYNVANHPRHRQCLRMIAFLRQTFEPTLPDGTTTNPDLIRPAYVLHCQHYYFVLLQGYYRWRQYDRVAEVWRLMVQRGVMKSTAMYHVMMQCWCVQGRAAEVIGLLDGWLSEAKQGRQDILKGSTNQRPISPMSPASATTSSQAVVPHACLPPTRRMFRTYIASWPLDPASKAGLKRVLAHVKSVAPELIHSLT